MSELYPWWIGGTVDGIDFKLFHEQTVCKGTNWEIQGCTMYLFKILTLEDKIYTYEAELHVVI